MATWGSGVTWGTGFIWGADAGPAPGGFQNGQVQLGDLTMGADTVYALELFEPWGEAEIRVDDRTRSQAEGLFSTPGRFGGRRVSFRLNILAATRNAALSALHDLSAAFAVDPEGDVAALIWREGGVTYRLHGQTRGVAADTRMAHQGVITCEVRFLATNPNVLSDSGHAITIQSRTKATVAVPLAIPLAWSTPTLGTGTVTNSGTAGTTWRAEITGPAVDPSIENATTGDVLRFRGHLASGDTILLDSELRSFVVDGGSAMSIVSPAPWWTFPHGSTSIKYRGGGELLMSWRDAWTP